VLPSLQPVVQQTLQQALQQAVHEGLLPAGARAPSPDSRPWPVVLLTGLGAWLAALPLLGVVGLLLGDFLRLGAGPYVAGSLLLAGATVVLRSQPLPVVVEQLALPVLLTGLGSLGAGLFRDADPRLAGALMALLHLGLAALVPRAWLRVLLGAAAAGLCALACLPLRWDTLLFGTHGRLGLALHAVLVLWLAAGALQPRLGPAARAAVESVRAGWVLALLVGLAWASGPTMLVGASLGGSVAGEWARAPWQPWRAESLPLQVLSLALALAAAGWAARQWPLLRQAWCGAAALVVTALAAFMPMLGATVLVLALLATGGRWRLALAAGLTLGWIVGAFYYALDWPLQLKALVLLAAGALLGVLAWWALQQGRQGPQPRPALQPGAPQPGRRARLGLALSGLAVLAVANGGIWQKEQLIAHGRPVYVELVPVDPRSLMQGDYMQLRFRLPEDVTAPAASLLSARRPQVLGLADARGVLTLRRADAGPPPAPGEVRIELTPKGGRWTLVTDAWFFAEGEAARWANARYGEFRVDGQGRALLVGLRDAALRPL
jgi:uncharacterized membrane-anchored protein